MRYYTEYMQDMAFASAPMDYTHWLEERLAKALGHVGTPTCFIACWGNVALLDDEEDEQIALYVCDLLEEPQIPLPDELPLIPRVYQSELDALVAALMYLEHKPQIDIVYKDQLLSLRMQHRRDRWAVWVFSDGVALTNYSSVDLESVLRTVLGAIGA